MSPSAEYTDAVRIHHRAVAELGAFEDTLPDDDSPWTVALWAESCALRLALDVAEEELLRVQLLGLES